MMSEKCKITFIFETDKNPVAEMYNEYSDGTSIKGTGNEIVGLCRDFVEDLIKFPLDGNKKIPNIKLNKKDVN